MGDAYGFFDCPAGYRQITAGMPKVRKALNIPSDLELTIAEGPANLSIDRSNDDLREMVRAMERKEFRYAVHARKNASNRDVAKDLYHLLTEMQIDPAWFPEPSEFQPEIYFHEDGEWLRT